MGNKRRIIPIIHQIISKQGKIKSGPTSVRKSSRVYRENTPFVDHNITHPTSRSHKLNVADIFSGSGIVSRYLRTITQGSLIANDIASYSYCINTATLKSHTPTWWDTYEITRAHVLEYAAKPRAIYIPFFSRWWSDGGEGGRKYFTQSNGIRLDKMIYWLATSSHLDHDTIITIVAGIIIEMSIHSNTSGHFASYYREIGGNTHVDLTRIQGDIGTTNWREICENVANTPATHIL
jgi:adenine-specific DNA methylase